MSDEGTTPDEMKRREFLGSMAAGGVAAATLGTGGCSAMLVQSVADRIDPEAVRDFLARFDHALDDVDSRPVLRRLIEQIEGDDALADASPGERARIADGDRVGRGIFRLLLVAGMVHDLPREARDTREVQERLEQLGPELDETVVELTRLVATSPRAVRRRAQEALQDPDVVMRFGEALAGRARDVGMGQSGRTRLRGTCTYVAGRLRRQPPDLLIDECLDKVERLAAGHGVDVAEWRRLTTEAPRHAWWLEPLDLDQRLAKSPEDASGEAVPEDASGEAAPEDATGEAAVADAAGEVAVDDDQPLDVTELLGRLTDPSLSRRVAAARALGERRVFEAVPVLANRLRVDPDPTFRGWALRALYQIHSREARDAVIHAARTDPDERVRQLALQLLGRTAPPPGPATPSRPGERTRDTVDPERTAAEAQLRRAGLGTFGTAAGLGGIGIVLTGVGFSADAYVATTGGILAGIGILLLIVGGISYGVRARRIREGNYGRGGSRRRRSRGER